jgi:hypothetical protein
VSASGVCATSSSSSPREREDHREEVVEVVRHAPGEAPDRLELGRLGEALLCVAHGREARLEPTVLLHQLSRALTELPGELRGLEAVPHVVHEQAEEGQVPRIGGLCEERRARVRSTPQREPDHLVSAAEREHREDGLSRRARPIGGVGDRQGPGDLRERRDERNDPETGSLELGGPLEARDAVALDVDPAAFVASHDDDAIDREPLHEQLGGAVGDVERLLARRVREREARERADPRELSVGLELCAGEPVLGAHEQAHLAIEILVLATQRGHLAAQPLELLVTGITNRVVHRGG